MSEGSPSSGTEKSWEKYRRILKAEAEKASKLSPNEQCLIWCKPISVMISEICRDLHLAPEVEKVSLSILRELLTLRLKVHFVGKNRLVMAASIIYLSGAILGLGPPLVEICPFVKVTGISLRNVAREIIYELGGEEVVRENFAPATVIVGATTAWQGMMNDLMAEISRKIGEKYPHRGSPVMLLEVAKTILKEASLDQHLNLKRFHRMTIASSILYISSYVTRFKISLKEMAETTGAKKKPISYLMNKVVKHLTNYPLDLMVGMRTLRCRFLSPTLLKSNPRDQY